MASLDRPTLYVSLLLATLVATSGHVAATSGEATADAQAGFGVLLAMIAILVALFLAMRRKRQYRNA